MQLILSKRKKDMEKVYDAHVHYMFNLSLEETVKIFKEEFSVTETEKYIFLSIPHHVLSTKITTDFTQNLKGLYLKKVFAPNGYAFAGLIHKNDAESDIEMSLDFLSQVETNYSVGFDGMKMLEGDASLRKAFKLPIDSPIYDRYYSFCEENNFPITMHVANPDENWDYSLASEQAIKLGRVYDNTYPTKEQLTNEVFGIMKKHPKLRLSLAHFGFFCKQIELAERFLCDYENTLLDITPGGEQLIYMSKNWEKWSKFFEKYQDRIIYGTDYYAFPKDENWEIAFNRRPKFIRQMFESNGEYCYLGDNFVGINLKKEIRDKIYRENFNKIYGTPKIINSQYIVNQCQKVIDMYKRFPNEIIDSLYIKDVTLSDDDDDWKKKKLDLDINDLKLIEETFK